MFEVWMCGKDKMEKFRYPQIDDQKLKNVADAFFRKDEKVKIAVWSDREVDPVREFDYIVGGEQA